MMNVQQPVYRIPRWFMGMFILLILLNIVQFGFNFRHKIYHLLYQIQVDVIAPNALYQAAGNQEMVVQSDRDGEMDVFHVKFDGGGQNKTLTNLTSDLFGDALYPEWRGEWVAFEFRPIVENPRVRVVGEPQIYIMKADGSGKQMLTAGSSPTWSPDGQSIYYTKLYTVETINGEQQRGDLWRYDLASQTETEFMTTERCMCIGYDQGIIIFSNWRVSPDGKSALFQLQSDSWYSTIYQWDESTQGAQTVDTRLGYYSGSLGVDPLWSPSGLITYGYGFASGATREEGRLIVPGGSPSWSPDGKHVVYDGLSGDRWHIEIMPADNTIVGRLLLGGDGASYAHPSWRS